MEIRNEIKLEIITDVQYFVQMLDSMHPVDVLFIDEALSVGMVAMPAVKNAYIISERHDANAVSKFDGAAGILRILGDDVRKSGSGSDDRECKIVNVVSPCGGCGKTLACIGIAYRLAQMNRKVLYVDAEYAQNFYEVMPKNSKRDVYADEQMAVSMINMTPKSFEDIGQKIIHGIFDYIPPYKNNLAGYHLSPQIFVQVAKIFANKGMYDYIIVEHGTGLCSEEIDGIYEDSRLVIVTNVAVNHDRVTRMIKLFRGYDGQGAIVSHNCDTPDSETGCGDFSLAEKVSFQKNDCLEDILAGGSYKKVAESML